MEPTRPRPPSEWTPWVVAPSSGFRVDDAAGEVALVQLTPSQFRVGTTFRFVDETLETELAAGLTARGLDADLAAGRVTAALTYWSTGEEPTDLASVPQFMRWFENAYGAHTLAAIIHDQLITHEPNGGALQSDIAADALFREMMRSAGVGFLKRWVMWAAVALRTRLVAGGARKLSVVVWIALALVGITTFVVGAVQTLRGDLGGVVVAAIALAVGLLASLLWGRQVRAGLIAMVGGFFIVPAAAVAFLGLAAASAVSRALGWLGLR
ncbi:MAG: DUF1353 domain-containing protein [Actinomycetota bacterium]